MSAHEEHEDHVPVYTKNAVILAVLTAIEVLILYLTFLPNGIMLLGLYGLATLKFGLVVALFMHLKYDNKLLTGVFFSGFTIALGTMIAMVALMNYQPTQAAHGVFIRDSKQLAEANAGDIDEGKKVFMAKGCAACHKITSLQGAAGVVGPELSQIGELGASRKDGMDAKAYIRESIENPNAYVVDGFAKGLMPATLRAGMTDTEYKDLVEYLASLK